ncbi:unnamed protein product [Thlaspi arvense]|uniref:KOW domain-containing protein n=1 Tax=Thlaspi arvense TaxID=13288 RepID=A0AAU9SQ43_THLAR|nr:unnamed protein product [Thlaspi arvense]
MATMSALQSSFTSLSISSNSSFLGQRLLSPISLSVASPLDESLITLLIVCTHCRSSPSRTHVLFLQRLVRRSVTSYYWFPILYYPVNIVALNQKTPSVNLSGYKSMEFTNENEDETVDSHSLILKCITVTVLMPLFFQLKRWERKKCKPNSLPILHKMHVKFGDTVKVISGRDKGKIGEVTKIFTHNSTIVIKDINLKTKHMKSREEGEPGQIVKIEAPIHSSNVMLYSKEKEVVSRVGHKVLEDGQKVRYLIKTGELIDTIEKWKQLKEAKDKESTQVAVASAS